MGSTFSEHRDPYFPFLSRNSKIDGAAGADGDTTSFTTFSIPRTLASGLVIIASVFLPFSLTAGFVCP